MSDLRLFIREGLPTLASRCHRHDIFGQAAALSFYTSLAIAPSLLIVLGLVGWVGFDLPAVFMTQVDRFMGDEASAAVRAILGDVNARPHTASWAGMLGLLTLAFSASSAFAQLHASLNVVWGTVDNLPKGIMPWIHKRLLSVGMVAVLVLAAILSLLAHTAFAFFFHAVPGLWQLGDFAVTWAIFMMGFAALFRYLPDAPVRWRHALWGGAATSLGFSLGKYVLGLYLGRGLVGSVYGAAGSVVVLLLWLYYSAVIFFVGAEVTHWLGRDKS